MQLVSRVRFVALLSITLLVCASKQATCEKELRSQGKNDIRAEKLSLYPEKIDVEVRQDLVGDCSPRVCFAIDGSSSVLDDQFERQKQIILLTVDKLSALGDAEFAAVQYGILISEISPLTLVSVEREELEKNEVNTKTGFRSLVNETEQLKSNQTFIAPGLQYCVSELTREANNMSKDSIVMMGDGNSNFGDVEGVVGAVSIAEQFEGEGNKVISVLLGRADGGLLRDIVGGDETKIIRINDDMDEAKIEDTTSGIDTAVDSLVNKICA